jgi:hypothetical protein
VHRWEPVDPQLIGERRHVCRFAAPTSVNENVPPSTDVIMSSRITSLRFNRWPGVAWWV